METSNLKPVDPLAFDPVMLEISKARAMASVLEQLGDTDNNLVDALEDSSHPEETREWLHSVVAEALRSALDEIETEYRKLGTNLLMKEAAKDLKPKDDGA